MNGSSEDVDRLQSVKLYVYVKMVTVTSKNGKCTQQLSF